jgi:hypothetical protein
VVSAAVDEVAREDDAVVGADREDLEQVEGLVVATVEVADDDDSLHPAPTVSAVGPDTGSWCCRLGLRV